MNAVNILPGDEPTNIKQLVLEYNPNLQNYHGFYRGTVIQNNDPERRGRVKIFIPSLAPQIKEKWFDVTTSSDDKTFRFPGGSNIYTDKPSLKDILDEAKAILPWAEQASSLIGGGSSGTLDYNKNVATISTAAHATSTNTTPAAGESGLNADNIPEKAAHKFETPAFQLNDGFVSLAQDKMPEINPYAYMFRPSSYSNCTNGVFTVPDVGASVWVFFENGDVGKPVYFAFSFDKFDWHAIHELHAGDTENAGLNYPAALENTKNSDSTLAKKGKTVWNSKGGTIEVIDTDEKESVKITHCSGSFQQWHNLVTVALSVANDQKLVKGDQFETTDGVRNIHVRKNLNVGVDETRWTRIGMWNTEAYAGWKDYNRVIADTRARFAIQRADTPPSASATSQPYGSTSQQKNGSPASNPILQEHTPNVVSPSIPDNIYTETPVASKSKGNQVTTKAVAVDPVKNNGSTQSHLSLSPDEFSKAAGSSGSDNFSGDPSLSQSSQDGSWTPDVAYANIAQLEGTQSQQMLQFETKFGNGGDEITEITRHRIDVVGAVFNDAPSIRIDAVGRIGFNEVLVSKKGAFASQKASQLVERVANDGKFPCGNYTLVVGNTLSVTTGSGGINLQTVGCVNIGGAQTVITGAQELNMSSSGDINLVGKKRVQITGDIVSLRQTEGKQVGVDSSLGVRNNIIIGGASYTEGEVYLHHITAPVEIQETEEVIVYGTTVTGKIIGWVNDENNWLPVYGGITPGGVADSDCVVNTSHSHNFKNLPLTLKANNELVRNAAASLNEGSAQIGALPVSNGKKVVEQS